MEKTQRNVSAEEAQELEVIDPNGGRPKTLEEESHGWGKTDEDGQKRLDLEIPQILEIFRGTQFWTWKRRGFFGHWDKEQGGW